MTQPRQVASSSVERTYYLIAGVYTLSASLIWGVNTMFLLGAGLSLMQAFLANAIFTGSMALFEVPTGIVADTKGRRTSFLLSVTLLIAGTLAYVAVGEWGGGMTGIVVASIVLGLGYTFYSGAVEAWLVDTLQSSGYDGPVDRVLARGSMISSIAMLIGSVSGGLLGGISLSLPYIVRSVLLLAAFVIGYRFMHESGFTIRALRWSDVPREMARVGRESLQFGWREPHARLAILASAMPWVFVAWGYYAWQPYFLELLGSTNVRVLGVVAAAVALAMAAGSWLVERLTKISGRRTTILLGAAVVHSVTAIGVGLTDSFGLALGLYLVGSAANSAFVPVVQAYLNSVISSERRATVLSLSSLVGSATSMGGQAGLGWLAASRSLGTGYIAGGIAAAFAIPWVVAMRRLGGTPDAIKGTSARFAACESLAIPAGAEALDVQDRA